MTQPINQQLRSITSFPQLVDYLCDELDWPINADDFESYTFEWDAAEDLGVAPPAISKSMGRASFFRRPSIFRGERADIIWAAPKRNDDDGEGVLCSLAGVIASGMVENLPAVR